MPEAWHDRARQGLQHLKLCLQLLLQLSKLLRALLELLDKLNEGRVVIDRDALSTSPGGAEQREAGDDEGRQAALT